MVKTETIRVLLVLANHSWHILQVVKTAFLHGSLDETIYMVQPPGYEQPWGVCKLDRALYGLKQASIQWNQCFSQFLIMFSLKPLSSDSCVFVSTARKDSGDILVVCIYVDDGLVMSIDEHLLARCIRHLRQRFEVTAHAPDTYVGFQIQRNRREGRMILHQSIYLSKVLHKFDMANATTVTIPMLANAKFSNDGANGVVSKRVDVPYRHVIRSLLYAALATRPELHRATVSPC